MNHFQAAVKAAVDAHTAQLDHCLDCHNNANQRYALAVSAMIMEAALNGCTVGGMRHLLEKDLSVSISRAIARAEY